jgi:hypothetical protein
MLIHLNMMEDESKASADTGSMTHVGIHHWHTSRFDVIQAATALKESITKYPLGDTADAFQNFAGYVNDPRNREAKLILNETKIRIIVDPAEEDQTKRQIVIEGTCDQVRESHGELFVWDIKTSLLDGSTILNNHIYQLAGYVVGAAQLLKKPVHPGGIIRTRGYLMKKNEGIPNPDGIFFHTPLRYHHCEMMIMKLLPPIVARIRAGTVNAPNPGNHCAWCPAKAPHNCLDTLYSLLK